VKFMYEITSYKAQDRKRCVACRHIRCNYPVTTGVNAYAT